LHEFDDNVAVVATTVASITTGIVQFRQNNARGGRWSNLWFGLRAWGKSTAPAAAGGVALAPAGLFQLPSHCDPPQTTVRERCERHNRT